MNEMAGAAFWGFVAVAVMANVAREVLMRRESEMTIRLAIEKGQQLDPATIDKLLRHSRKGGADSLMVGGGVTLATGLGLPIMGYFILEAFRPLLGVGLMISIIGLTLLVLSAVIRSRRAQTGQGLS
jgi:hypothetical protein